LFKIFGRRIELPFPGGPAIVGNDGIPGLYTALVIKELQFSPILVIQGINMLHKRQDSVLLMREWGNGRTDRNNFAQNKYA